MSSNHHRPCTTIRYKALILLEAFMFAFCVIIFQSDQEKLISATIVPMPGIQYSFEPGVVRDAQTIYTEEMDARYGRGQLVFAYPPPPGQSPEELMACFTVNYPTPLVDNSAFHEPGSYVPEDLAEWYLHRQLSDFEDLTLDPGKAGLFVVNAMPVLSSVVGSCNGMTHAERDKWWVATLQASPWFRLRGGKDHAFICQSWTCGPNMNWNLGRGRRTWFGSKAVHSAVQPNLGALVQRMTYWIHEDISLWTGRDRGDRVVVVPYVAHSEVSLAHDARTTRVLFMGSLSRNDVIHTELRRWRQPLETLRDVRVIDSGVEHSRPGTFGTYADEMRSATFCLVVAGDTASSRRLFDAVLSGCLPVLVGPPSPLPFEHAVNWGEFTVRLDGSRWTNGMAQSELERLANITVDQLSTMRSAMAAAAPLLNWRRGDGVLRALLEECRQVGLLTPIHSIDTNASAPLLRRRLGSTESTTSSRDVSDSNGAANLCGWPAQQWLVLLATGRSGSTTLLNTLNAVPGIRMAGESVAQIGSFQAIYERARSLGWGVHDTGMPRYYHTAVDEGLLLRDMQRSIRDLVGGLESDNVVGFKAIRPINNDTIAFLRRVLGPCVHFVTLTRNNVEAQLRSQARAGWHPDWLAAEGRDDLILQNAVLARVGGLHLKTETLSPSVANQLLRWIGQKDCHVQRLSSSNGGGLYGETQNASVRCDADLERSESTTHGT